MPFSTLRNGAFAALALFGFGAGALLPGCQEKGDGPEGSACDTAATVVDNAGAGLVLQLADGSYVVPTGAAWTNFKATAGQAVTVGYAPADDDFGDGEPDGNRGQTVELGCIRAGTP